MEHILYSSLHCPKTLKFWLNLFLEEKLSWFIPISCALANKHCFPGKIETLKCFKSFFFFYHFVFLEWIGWKRIIEFPKIRVGLKWEYRGQSELLAVFLGLLKYNKFLYHWKGTILALIFLFLKSDFCKLLILCDLLIFVSHEKVN